MAIRSHRRGVGQQQGAPGYNSPAVVTNPPTGLPPTPAATFIMDTRSGGAQDITAQATLAAAQTKSGVVAIQGNNALAPLWTTTFENNASGHAWILGWTHIPGLEQDLQLSKAGMDFGGIFCGQYKTWYGRTTNGGGYGTVGFYDQALGHKSAVIFRRATQGGASTNNNRITTLHNYNYQGANHGQALSVDGWVQGDGSLAATYNLMQDNTSDPNLGAGTSGGMTGGITPVTNLNTIENSVITMTWKMVLESAQGASDGLFLQWVNNTQVFAVLNAKTGASPYRWKEWQIGGPTWTNGGPSADCTQYVWDIVIWNPAS